MTEGSAVDGGPVLETPATIGDLRVPNRLYRAPLLECAGNGPDAVETLVADLEPAAAAGAGLVCQGATIVRGEGGCAAPGMTRVHDPTFVEELSQLTAAVHDHGGAIAVQLEHGGLRSMETWHAGYRAENPTLEQLAVSRPPALLRALDATGFLDYDVRVLSTDEVYDLAADFGRAAARCVEAGYDAVHLSGANMGIVQQFLSPFYNHREDEFGGSLAGRCRFLELVGEEIRRRAGDVPLMTKVPSERPAPPFVRRHLEDGDAVEIAARLDAAGFDALVPVRTSVFWDMSIVRGEYPARAWNDAQFREGYAAAFGSELRARVVAALNRIEALTYDRDRCWNADLCRRVRERVEAAVLCEGGVRTREHVDDIVGDAADMVGLGRPFYAEPRLPARLLHAGPETAVACQSCNNCTVPQVTGAAGVCRTPSVLRRRGELDRAGAYDRADPDESRDAEDGDDAEMESA
jgi:2,4-dienoyl-CoA reductase-like NADH-dependent reductase (Old Yellow Enzyme family)